jgi:hypothetical protein
MGSQIKKDEPGEVNSRSVLASTFLSVFPAKKYHLINYYRMGRERAKKVYLTYTGCETRGRERPEEKSDKKRKNSPPGTLKSVQLFFGPLYWLVLHEKRETEPFSTKLIVCFTPSNINHNFWFCFL